MCRGAARGRIRSSRSRDGRLAHSPTVGPRSWSATFSQSLIDGAPPPPPPLLLSWAGPGSAGAPGVAACWVIFLCVRCLAGWGGVRRQRRAATRLRASAVRRRGAKQGETASNSPPNSSTMCRALIRAAPDGSPMRFPRRKARQRRSLRQIAASIDLVCALVLGARVSCRFDNRRNKRGEE